MPDWFTSGIAILSALLLIFNLVKGWRDVKKNSPIVEWRSTVDARVNALEEHMHKDHRRISALEDDVRSTNAFQRINLRALFVMLRHMSKDNCEEDLRKMSADLQEFIIMGSTRE